MYIIRFSLWAIRYFLACNFFELTSAYIDLAQWQRSFKTEPGPGGDCLRQAPSGGDNMFSIALLAVSEAWDVTSKVVEILDTYTDEIAGVRPRGLLFLLFGVRFKSSGTLADSTQQHVFDYVKGTFEKINKLKTEPADPKPSMRCLEDYATYYEHKLGTDGKENKSDILIAEFLGRRMKNGQYYPGMMYIENGGMWYSPAQYDPPNGGCADRRPGRKTLAFTLRKTQIAGVTLCTRFFNRRSFFSLGEPGENLGIAGINTYVKTSTIALVHEFAHLVDSNIKDEDAMKPPPGETYDNRDWWSWVSDDTKASYGYTKTIYLGLTKPWNAISNADSYAILALCLYYVQLDCLGTFQDEIRSSRRSLPFQVSQRAMEKIRSGEMDITNM